MRAKGKSVRKQFGDLIRQKLNGTITLEEYEEKVAQLAVSLGLMQPWEVPDLKNRYKPKPRRSADRQMLLGFGQPRTRNTQQNDAFHSGMTTRT